MKKTAWYPKNIKPVRTGWYEVQGCSWYIVCTGRHYWDGERWAFLGSSIPVPALPWRGLTTRGGK